MFKFCHWNIQIYVEKHFLWDKKKWWKVHWLRSQTTVVWILPVARGREEGETWLEQGWQEQRYGCFITSVCVCLGVRMVFVYLRLAVSSLEQGYTFSLCLFVLLLPKLGHQSSWLYCQQIISMKIVGKLSLLEIMS